jgi:ribonuclease Z
MLVYWVSCETSAPVGQDPPPVARAEALRLAIALGGIGTLPELIVLGTAASVPDADHDTVGLVLRGPDWAVLIDCGGSPLHKLARIGVTREEIQAVILTHRHADHIYGLPMLVQGLWLGGREPPLPVHGPAEVLSVARRLLALFNLDERDDMFRLEWHPVPLREGQSLLKVDNVRITSAPAVHGDAQTIALRFDNLDSGRSAVYSADTEPCAAVARLAAGVDLLLHEATGSYHGHSSAAQAAEVAREAGVQRLALIHYPVHGRDLDAWRGAVAESPGVVALADDGDMYAL